MRGLWAGRDYCLTGILRILLSGLSRIRPLTPDYCEGLVARSVARLYLSLSKSFSPLEANFPLGLMSPALTKGKSSEVYLGRLVSAASRPVITQSSTVSVPPC